MPQNSLLLKVEKRLLILTSSSKPLRKNLFFPTVIRGPIKRLIITQTNIKKINNPHNESSLYVDTLYVENIPNKKSFVHYMDFNNK